MTLSIRKSYLGDCLLAATALANNEIEKNTLEAVQRLRGVVDHPPATSLGHERVLCNAIDLRITAAALSCSLYFRASKPLAIITGAGIAGLAASFKLRAKGFNVVIAEKRKNFSRFNVINLKVEIQVFLKEP